MKSLATLALLATAAFAQAPATSKTFDMYFLDTEGGHAVLYVTPTGQSLLDDVGSAGERDHDRIMAALKDAGIKELDYLVLSHYHSDHVGGFDALLKDIPVKHFIDHGTAHPTDKNVVVGFEKRYSEIVGDKRVTVKPGDKIPVTGINAVVVTSHGKVLKTPVAGAAALGAGKPNSGCATFEPRDESTVDPDNGNSVGIVFNFGKFRTVNLGDYTWNAEKELMCPNNPIGSVDLFLTSHHGVDASNSPALVHGLRPRVIVMHNGQRKGGAVQTFNTMYTSPLLEDIWQLHWAFGGGTENNAPGRFIANVEEPAALANAILAPPGGGRGPGGPPPTAAAPAPGATPISGAGPARGGGRGGRHEGPAFWIKVSAKADGSFTVTNTRNQFTKSYAAK